MTKAMILLFGVIFLLSGCSSTKSPPIDQSQAETVMVYPLLDMRANKRHNIKKKFARYPVSEKYMETRGIPVRFGYDHRIGPRLSISDFTSPNREKLKQLKTAGEKYVLVVFMKKYHDTTLKNIGNVATAFALSMASANTATWSVGDQKYYVGFEPVLEKDYITADAFLVRKETGDVIWGYSGQYRGVGFIDFPVVLKPASHRKTPWLYHRKFQK